MEKIINILLLIICLGLFFSFVPVKAVNAYLDPGTGSYLIQILLAGVFSGLFFIHKFWKNLKNVFFRNVKEPKSKQDE